MTIKPKELLVVLALFAVLVTASYFISDDTSANAPAFTMYSAREDGLSLLYDSLDRLDYPVKTSTWPLTETAHLNDVYIIVEPDFSYIQEEDIDDMLRWVSRGGRLIFLETERPTYPEWLLENHDRATADGFSLYRLGMGELLTGTCTGLLNQNLMTDRKAGKLVQVTLDNWGYENIYFAEYYHGFQSGQSPQENLWRYLPGGFKIILLQIIMVAVLVIWRLGKRFGRPVPYYEEIDRDENEYLVSLSGVYQNAGLGGLILRIHFKRLVNQSAVYFNVSAAYATQNLETLWRTHNLPHEQLLSETLNILAQEKLPIKKKSDRKQFLQAIGNIRTLRSCTITVRKGDTHAC